MRISIILLSTCAILAQSASAQSVLDKISKGASKAGEAVSSGASKAGSAVKGAAGAVGDSIDSTTELLSDEDTPELTRQRLDASTVDTLVRLFSENPAAEELFNQSAGYAVFDSRQVGLVGVSAGYGRGVAVSKDTEQRTYMNMGTGGVGFSLGIGGFERQVVILFEEADKFRQFVETGYDATAETGAMFGDDKVDQSVRFVDGRSIFVLTKKGWKVSASAAGTKYWVDADLN